MKVLITGGCGFVGVNLIKHLSAQGHFIRIIDDLSAGGKEEIEKLDLSVLPELTVGDVRDKQAVETSVYGMDAVVHLAAFTRVVESLENPAESWDINVGGIFNVLEACRRHQTKRFVFASSNAVAGEQTPPIDESKLTRPLSPYGASKLTGEALCSAYAHSYGIGTVALRFANLYGPHADHKPSVVARFLRWARDETPFVVYGDGNQTRDFVHVEDVCQAISLSLTHENIRGEVFQIASGKETSVNELIEILKEVTGKRLQVNYEPERTGEIKRNFSDISKARKVLGFNPEIELKSGLAKLW